MARNDYSWRKWPVVYDYLPDYSSPLVQSEMAAWGVGWRYQKMPTTDCDSAPHPNGVVVICLDKSIGIDDITDTKTRGSVIVGAVVHLSPGAERSANIVGHELGHALGLGHDPDPSSIMYGGDNWDAKAPTQHDLDALHRLYHPNGKKKRS